MREINFREGILIESREECVMLLAEWIRDRLGESQEEIGGSDESDPRWAEKVAGCMKMIVEVGE